MNDINTPKIIEILNKIMQYELSGVVRYTHYSLMITGRDRLSLSAFFKEQANESLLHAQEAGELVTGLGGHPSVSISNIKETNNHHAKEHEENAVIYKELLNSVKDKSIYIEEYARGMIKAEEHSLEIRKMLIDFS